MREIPSPEGPRMLILRCSLSKKKSIFAEDLGRASEKRIIDHSSGRWLLEQALLSWGINDISQIEVRRDDNRAPYLSWIPGCWRNEPLPNISIAHCESAALVALIESSYWVGIDAELANRGIAENAFDMMAKDEELILLRNNPHLAIDMWTSKEAIQKAHHLGTAYLFTTQRMHTTSDKDRKHDNGNTIISHKALKKVHDATKRSSDSAEPSIFNNIIHSIRLQEFIKFWSHKDSQIITHCCSGSHFKFVTVDEERSIWNAG